MLLLESNSCRDTPLSQTTPNTLFPWFFLIPGKMALDSTIVRNCHINHTKQHETFPILMMKQFEISGYFGVIFSKVNVYRSHIKYLFHDISILS